MKKEAGTRKQTAAGSTICGLGVMYTSAAILLYYILVSGGGLGALLMGSLLCIFMSSCYFCLDCLSEQNHKKCWDVSSLLSLQHT